MARPRPKSVPSTSPSGWTWPSMRALPRGRRRASSSAAGGSTDRRVTGEAAGALTSVGIRGVRAPRLELGEQGLDVRGVLHRAIRPEEQLGRRAEVEVPAQPAPHEAARALQGLQRGGPLRLRTQHRDVDLGVLEVRARVDLGDGDEAETRILELTLDEHRDLFLDQLVDPLESLGLHRLSALTTPPRGRR